MTLPRYYKWGGGSSQTHWSFGWETGKDGDLICIKPNISSRLAGEINLSPSCSSRFLAFIAFILKAILEKIDYNMRISES